MTHTKSLRLEDDEVEAVRRIQEALRFPTEAALMKRAFLLGLDEMRLEMAIRLYTVEGLSLGEAAEAAGIPVAVLGDRFRERGIRVMDVPAGLALANLARRARELGAPALAEAAEGLARRASAGSLGGPVDADQS